MSRHRQLLRRLFLLCLGCLKVSKPRHPIALGIVHQHLIISYSTTQHFLDFALRYMRVGGVPVNSQVYYVTLHLLKGEARTWYDLRCKRVMSESFESFARALNTHFANYNSQCHYLEALQSLSMTHFKDVMQYNQQTFRRMMLCLEDMTELDYTSCRSLFVRGGRAAPTHKQAVALRAWLT